MIGVQGEDEGEIDATDQREGTKVVHEEEGLVNAGVFSFGVCWGAVLRNRELFGCRNAEFIEGLEN